MKNNGIVGKALLAGLGFVAVAALSTTACANEYDVDAVNFDEAQYVIDVAPSDSDSARWAKGNDDQSTVSTNTSPTAKSLLVDTVASLATFTPVTNNATHLSFDMEMVAANSAPAPVSDAKLMLYFDGTHVKVSVDGGTTWNDHGASVTEGTIEKVDVYFTTKNTKVTINRTENAYEVTRTHDQAKIKHVAFSGYGVVDNIDLKYLAATPGPVETAEYTESLAKTYSEIAEIRVPDAVSDQVSDTNAYQQLFAVVPVNVEGAIWKLGAELNEAGTNAVIDALEEVQSAVQAKLGPLAVGKLTAEGARDVEISNLTPGFYYAIGTADELTANEFRTTDFGWRIADGKNKGSITLQVPEPNENEDSQFYVIKVKTSAE